MPFERRDGELCADAVPLREIAERVGTPTYVYSWPDIRRAFEEVTAAFDGMAHKICYAVKANSNLSVLSRLAKLGAGFDIVSGGELERVMVAGGDPATVVFSGVGKSEAEIDFAIKAGIHCFNVESAAELDRIERRARLLERRTAIAVRVNPDIDPNTHPYISTGLRSNKFGVPAATALAMYRTAAGSDVLDVAGIDCHIGSQIADTAPYQEALDLLLDLVDQLKAEGIELQHVDLGGGFGITYQDELELNVSTLGELVRERFTGCDLALYLEPGRALVANAGVLITRIEYLKHTTDTNAKSFAVVDAAMNDLIRPALYQAWHHVESVGKADGTSAGDGAPTGDGTSAEWDIVGPVCESGDFLALSRTLTLAEGDLLAIHSAGAYGFVQSSNYNSRPRAAEVLVDGNEFHIARRRESMTELLRAEDIV